MNAREHRTGQGIAWTIGRAVLQLVFGTGVGIILARLLSPRDFGIAAIAMAFGYLTEALAMTGLSAAIVQRRPLRYPTVATALTLSLLFALGLGLIFVLSASYIASWYGTAELRNVSLLTGVTIVAMMLGVVPRALLRRHMYFRTLATIDFVSYLLGYGAVSITLAWLGWGVWSLALGTLFWWTMATLACWRYGGSINWRPGWDAAVAKELIRFSLPVSGKSIVVYLGGVLDSLLLGKLLGPESLGLYQRAALLASIPVARLGSTIGHVMFPAYVLILDRTDRLRHAFLSAQRVITLICLPLLMVLAAFPEVVIIGLYGARWHDAAPVLRILAIVGFFDVMHHLGGSIIEAKGMAATELRLQTGYVLLLAASLVGGAQFGLSAAAWAHLLPSLVLAHMVGRLALRLAAVSVPEWFRANLAGFGLAAVVVLAAKLGISWVHIIWGSVEAALDLVVVTIVSAATYLLGLWFIPGQHQVWKRPIRSSPQ